MPAIVPEAIAYLQQSWPDVTPVVYENCISNSLDKNLPLPQWYLLKKGKATIGCAGLITNDFISRMDLYPWLCALFIDPKFRGNNYGALLIDQAKKDAMAGGFNNLHLCTDKIGYYEKLGFEYIGMGYHPWNESSRIYQLKLK